MLKALLMGMGGWQPNVIVTPAGRKLWLNEAGDGIVMEHQFTKGGSTARFVIALAKDRAKKRFGTYGTDMPGLTNYMTVDTSETWYLNGSSNAGVITKTDAQMRAVWSASIDANTAKQNCDIWMTKNTTTDSKGIVGVPAVAYCRSVTIGGVACDLPNEQELMLMRLEADEIDKLDPTVAQYPTYALGSANPEGFWRFSGANIASSSTEYDINGVRRVGYTGYCLYAEKHTECGIAPIREIPPADFDNLHGTRVPGGIAIGYDYNSPYYFADGKWGWLVVSPASQRKASIKWGLYGTDTTLTNYTSRGFTDAKTGAQNTDVLTSPTYVYTDDGYGSVGAPAATYCQNLEFEGGTDFFLPNYNETILVRTHKSLIDSLDETGTANPTFKLSNWGFGSVNGAYLWCSSEYSSNNAWIVSASSENNYAKSNQCGVVPARRIVIS